MRKNFLVHILAGTLMVCANLAHPQSYPTKPVHIIVPGPGGIDVGARQLAPILANALGQNVVVENKPSGVIPGQTVARAQPDGHTLLFSGGAHWIAPLTTKDVPYDPIKDFAAIVQIYTVPYVLFVHEKVPAKSVKELIALAKSRPGQLNIGASSPGSASTLTGVLLSQLADIKLTIIPYKSGDSRRVALLSGEIEVDFASAAESAPLLKSDKVRAIGISSEKPSTLFPGIPTVAETVPGYESGSTSILFAPFRTPTAAVNRLNQEINKMLGRPDVRQILENLNAEPLGGSSQAATNFIKSDTARVQKMLTAMGVTPQ